MLIEFGFSKFESAINYFRIQISKSVAEITKSLAHLHYSGLRLSNRKGPIGRVKGRVEFLRFSLWLRVFVRVGWPLRIGGRDYLLDEASKWEKGGFVGK